MNLPLCPGGGPKSRSMKNPDSRQRGFTLIEVLGALVVGSLVFASAAFAISGALESARVSGFNDTLAFFRMNIQEVYASARGFGSTSSSSADITSELIETGAVPQNWLVDEDSTSIIHGFGGAVTVTGTVANFEISASEVPQSACRKIVNAQYELWDEVTVNGAEVDGVPTTACAEDNGTLGTNTLTFTAH